MNKIIIPVLASVLILGTLVSGVTPNAYAAEGTVVWLNPAEKLGKIAEDGCEDESCYHPFQIPKDLADPDYDPQVGDKVTFDPAPGNTASNVAIAGDPSITPTEGPIGTPFTITDPQGRIQAGDLAFFTPEGGDPALSGIAVVGVISPDGTTFSGTVPVGISELGLQLVRVAEAGDQPGRFADLPFFVTSLPPATVTIHLQDSNNNPIPDAFCRVTDDTGGFRFVVEGFTDENGQVTLSWDNPFLTNVILACFQDNTNFVLIGLTCIPDAPRAVLITEGDTFCIFDPV